MEKSFIQQAILKSLTVYGAQTQNQLYQSVKLLVSCTQKTFRKHLKQMVEGCEVAETPEGSQKLRYSLTGIMSKNELLKILNGLKKEMGKSRKNLHNHLKPFKNKDEFAKIPASKRAYLFDLCHQTLRLLIESTKYYSLFNSKIWGGPIISRLSKEIQKKQQEEIDDILNEIREIDYNFYVDVSSSVFKRTVKQLESISN